MRRLEDGRFMETYLAVIAVCTVVIALELGLVVAAFIMMSLAIREGARAIETLAYRVDEEVEQVGSAMRSGWVRSLQALAGIASGVWLGKKKE